MVPSAYPLPAARAAFAELTRALESFRTGQRAKYGVYVEDLHSGLSVNLDGDDRYIAASTTKFPVSLYVFYHGAIGELDLATEVEYLPQDRTGGTGVIQHAPFGTRYTLRQLCYHAIVDSDNVAWHMLYRALGEPAIKAWMRSIGGRQAISGINVAAPTDYAVYSKFLLRFADQHPNLGGTLIDWLKRSGYAHWAPRYLPASAPMAHKIGAWPTAINDVGIVFLPRAPYLLCLMSDLTDDPRLTVAIDNLARIGRIVYRHMEPLAGRFASVYLNGRRLAMTHPGCVLEGHLVVPLRSLAEALGARVLWDGALRVVVLERGRTRVEVTVGQRRMRVNDGLRELPVAPFLYEDRTIAPLRTVAEALGARVGWDPERYRALLTL